MSKDQIQANFKAAHSKAVQDVADAQYHVMNAQAGLAAARAVQRELEKKFREDMASATSSPQIPLFEDTTKKK